MTCDNDTFKAIMKHFFHTYLLIYLLTYAIIKWESIVSGLRMLNTYRHNHNYIVIITVITISQIHRDSVVIIAREYVVLKGIENA